MTFRPLMILFLGLFMTALTAVSAPAATVGGVTLPDSVSVDGTTLVLNGAGLRTKFFVKVYAGALYTPSKATDRDAVQAAPVKLIRMVFIHSSVDADKITGAFREGLEANAAELDDAAMNTFLGFFTDAAVEGDVIDIAVTESTVSVSKNDAPLGSITSAPLATGIVDVFVGEHPAQDSLKEGMLGD